MHQQLFHAVCFQDRGYWVAQCLERNLVTASKDPRELPRQLKAVLRVQIEIDQEAGIEPFTSLPQAPHRFWQMFKTAEPWRFDDKGVEPPSSTPVRMELYLVQ